MTRSRNEEVVWFDISVNPAKGMRFFNTEDHFRDVELRDRFREYVITDEKAKEVAPRHVVHDKI
jgi:hypothetical protein